LEVWHDTLQKVLVEQWLLKPQPTAWSRGYIGTVFSPVMDGDPIYGYSLWVKNGYSTVPIKMDG
jgi:hypothetical protein